MIILSNLNYLYLNCKYDMSLEDIESTIYNVLNESYVIIIIICNNMIFILLHPRSSLCLCKSVLVVKVEVVEIVLPSSCL